MACIVAPIKYYKDYTALINSSAGEFYVGIIPEYWREIYGSIGLNRRDFSFCNLKDFNQLCDVVSACHNANKAISVTLNNHFYTAEQETLIKRVIEDCVNAGVDSLIIADPTLTYYIKESGFSVGITISCEAGCYSAQDIKFFSELGANRIIFPRDMTLMEMKAAIGLANLPNMEYEAFVFGPRCTYSGAYCTVSHGLLTGPSFCSYKLRHAVVKSDGESMSEQERKQIGNLFDERNQWAFDKDECGKRIDACGICAIQTLQEIGVNFFKVVGREYSLKQNLYNIELVKKGVLEKMCFGNRGRHCEKGFACYYSMKDVAKTSSNTEVNSHVEEIVTSDQTVRLAMKSPPQKDEHEIAILITNSKMLNSEWLLSRVQEFCKKELTSVVSPQVKRIYFGNEFCEKKVPTVDELRKVCDFCKENEMQLTLLLPPMSTNKLIEMTGVIDTISSLFPIEVVCNSWGSIYAFKGKPNITLAFGRLLNKVKHDPFIYSNLTDVIDRYSKNHNYSCIDTKSLIDYFHQSNINTPSFNQMLLSNGIQRIETDIPNQLLVHRRFSYTLYYPIQYVTFGRYCLWGALNEKEPCLKFKPNQKCDFACEKYLSKLGSYLSDSSLFSKGCAVFSHTNFAINDIDVFDRIVVELSLPI